MKTYQYTEPRQKVKGDTDRTHLIAASRITDADMYAAAHGWRRGPLVFDDNETDELFDLPGFGGIDVVLRA